MARVYTKFFFVVVIGISLVGCDPAELRDYKKAKNEIQKGHYKDAVMHLQQVVDRDPEKATAIEAAREGARISYYELKDFKSATEFYRTLVLYSKDPSERLNAQKQIADIFFNQLTNYKQAVIELNKVLSMISEPDEMAPYKVNLARSYFYQSNFFQAESEVDEFLRGKISKDNRFQMLVLKGNIFIAKKDVAHAAEVFKEVISLYPEKAAKENVYITLAVAYEEIKDFKDAIETLEALKKFHPMPEYIDIRINRLKESSKKQPGARGFRK